MDIQDNDGNSPLHLAAADMDEQVIKFLVEKCYCNPKLANKQGSTPHDTVQ